MSKIIRSPQKIFGAGAPASDMLQFGSRAANTPVQSFDPAVIQALPTWNTGIRGSLLANAQGVMIPVEQDRNAVDYVTTYQLAYLFQEGIAEYDASTTYYQNSFVKKPGTTQVYTSLTDSNTGNVLTDVVHWKAGLDIGGSSAPPLAPPDYSNGVSLNNNTVYQATTGGWLYGGSETYHVYVGSTNNPTIPIFAEGGGTYNVIDSVIIPQVMYYKYTSSPSITATFYPFLVS